MKKITLILALPLFLSACQVTGPSVRVDPPKVKIPGVEIEGQSNHKHGKFCPPGQAKKGNC